MVGYILEVWYVPYLACDQLRIERVQNRFLASVYKIIPNSLHEHFIILIFPRHSRPAATHRRDVKDTSFISFIL